MTPRSAASSRASAVSISASSAPDGGSAGNASPIPTPAPSSPDTGRTSPATPTSAHSATSSPSRSSAAASPASPSALPGSDSPKPILAGSGRPSPASSPTSDLPLFSSRTCRDCDQPDCGTCWPTLPSSGSMRSGRLRAHATSARRTSGRAFSSWLPTPTAQSYGSNQGGSAGRRGQRARPSLETLLRRALLPTPTVCGEWNRRSASPRSGDGLATVAGLSVRLSEWMMGFPERWSGVDVSATPSSRKSPSGSGNG